LLLLCGKAARRASRTQWSAAEESVRFFRPIKCWLASIGERGAAVIEFAIVGSSFFMMVLACFELGFMLFVQSALDNAARDAARLIRTGQLQSAGDPSTVFQTQLCAGVSSLISCANLVYQAQGFGDWSSAQTAMNTPLTRDQNGNLVSSGFSFGVASQIMVVTVIYNYAFFTAWIASLLNTNGSSAFLTSTIVFQNEPY
jgi:Flp pilus assembly protein TadG